jgi:hypothetical protein
MVGGYFGEPDPLVHLAAADECPSCAASILYPVRRLVASHDVALSVDGDDSDRRVPSHSGTESNRCEPGPIPRRNKATLIRLACFNQPGGRRRVYAAIARILPRMRLHEGTGRTIASSTCDCDRAALRRRSVPPTFAARLPGTSSGVKVVRHDARGMPHMAAHVVINDRVRGLASSPAATPSQGC